MKEWMARKRAEGANKGANKAPKNVSTDVSTDVSTEQELDAGWRVVISMISRPRGLEKMQAICGSLGKYAEQVWLGQTGITIKDIGEAIGVGAPIVPNPAPRGSSRDYCGRLRGAIEVRDVTPLCERTDEHAHAR